MTDTPVKVVVDCEKGETKYIPLSAEEIAQMKKDAEVATLIQAEREAAAEALAALKASAKAKLIAGQPLTAEEADTLVL